MSWFKFWKSSKRDDKQARSDLVKSETFKEESGQSEAEKEKNRLRHSMSISRSGRFKQKNKQRSGILDKAEFINGSTSSNDSHKENNNVTQAAPTNFEQKRTPPSTCRDVSGRQPITARHFEGHSTVL